MDYPQYTYSKQILWLARAPITIFDLHYWFGSCYKAFSSIDPVMGLSIGRALEADCPLKFYFISSA